VDLAEIYEVNQWLIQIVFFSLLILAAEGGYRLGRRAAATVSEKTRSQVSVVEGSLVGVLGLLLGFTMSMAVSRYEARKELVLAEANAIGTSWLRTQLLPEPYRAAIADSLRRYVDLRTKYGEAGSNHARLHQIRENTFQLQSEFWRKAVEYGRTDANPVRSGLLLQSLNQVIDLEASRWMAFFNHVPPAVICLDGAVAWLAALLVGYGFGIERARNIFSTCLLALAISVVLAVIVDLDRPRQGFIQVTQQPVIDLQRQMNPSSHE
jgi:hypothetical protein